MIRIQIADHEPAEFETFEHAVRYLVWMSRAQEHGPLRHYGPVEPPPSTPGGRFTAG
jgi:hypothetical protein